MSLLGRIGTNRMVLVVNDGMYKQRILGRVKKIAALTALEYLAAKLFVTHHLHRLACLLVEWYLQGRGDRILT